MIESLEMLRGYCSACDEGELTQLGRIADRVELDFLEKDDEIATLRNTIKSGCLELPRDARGEYIHIGDRMMRDGISHSIEVRSLNYYPDGWRVNLDNSIDCEPEKVWHWREPTVENVLENLIRESIGTMRLSHREKALISEYAKKLRLEEG